MKNNTVNKENNRKTLKWIYSRIKRYFPLIIVVSIMSAVSALIGVAIALITKKVFDIATGEISGSLFAAGVLLFTVITLQILLGAANSLMNTYTSGKLTMYIRNYLFGLVCRKKYANLSAYHSGDILNRFTSDTDVIVSSSVSVIPSMVSMITKIISGIGTLLVLNPYLAILVLLLGFCVPAIGRMINKRYKKLHKICQQTEGKARSFLQECFENIVVIKTFASEIPFINKLDSYMKENFHVKLKRSSITAIAHICLYSFFTIGYYALMLWGAAGISAGTVTYGTLMAFLQLISQLSAPLQNISGIMPQYYSALASAERLMELENLESEKSALDNEEINAVKQSFKTIEVNNVNFAYDGELILKDCSFSAERGCITAITGESGSGKSTVFKVMLGLYEPQSGNITINKDRIVDTSVRAIFSYVPQGNMVLSGSIRDNITLCNPEITEEKVIEAVKAAEIYDFIQSLPDGLDTVLSERGAGLSEGQIQRISIARALLVDAPVLLLDEATSALDEATETKVLTNIKNMTDKTILFITHRNTSLKACDRIVHVESKKFVVIK